MVQNTVGRIYLDNNPYEKQLQKKWQYLIEPSEKPSDKTLLKYNELEDLKVADLACGSGHILNECFDLLYDLYIAEGYGRGEAVENIFSHNLTGIDLDTRAKQLATFALLLKACQKDVAFADAHCMPNVLTMPKPWNKEVQGPIQDMLYIYFQGEASYQQNEEIVACFDLMQDADSLGSIMKFDISESTRLLIKQTTDYWCNQELVPEEVRTQIAAFKLILTLTEKYHVLIANPPYMGRGHMTSVLSNYLDKNYPNAKSDLFSTFMDMMLERIVGNGKTAFITMESWMFLSSFEKFRKNIIDNYHIASLGHFGWHIIGIAFGTAMTVINKCKSNGNKGVYSYLTIDDIDREKNVPFVFPKKDNGRFAIVEQKNFEKIPGCPIAYWISEKIQNIFIGETVGNHSFSDGKNVTSDNERFLRFLWEVSKSRIGKEKKWMLQTKGGEARRWYGNTLNVIAWSPEDIEYYHKNKMARVIKEYLWYKKGITWSKICSKIPTFRYLRTDSTYDEVNITPNNEEELYCILGVLNTKVANMLLSIVNPTFSVQTENILKMPFTFNHKISAISESCIKISRSDWDAHETSWDFQRNELLSIDTSTYTENIDYKIEKHFEETGEHISLSPAAPQLGSLEWRMEQYKTKWERKFMQLHENEEELNRQFIDIYDLQDELTPNVPLNEITILQLGEINVAENGISWNEDVMTKQLISYAVGCMLGRYRLDKPGLHIAHPNPTDEEIAPYEYNGEQWEIDDDGIMPLMSNDCGFSDNASARFADFIRVALGNEEHVANLNYVEKCLGKPLEQYFVKDFWKDHKKMYQNRPIYWLFSSKKGAFQVIAYMHRMNAYTAERVRSKYLLPYIEHLEAEIDKLDARRAELSTKETKQLQALQKQLDECREYHERLQVVAEQAISFDLDDGVVVNYAKFGDILQKIK